MRDLHAEIEARCQAAPSPWPCHRGCDHCCRHLASEPLLTAAEWELLAPALPANHRIQETANATRPVTCPLLDLATGTCQVYEVRPIACRTYGYYAERDKVLGCSQIEALATNPDIIWGNHSAIVERTKSLGEIKPLSEWLRDATETR